MIRKQKIKGKSDRLPISLYEVAVLRSTLKEVSGGSHFDGFFCCTCGFSLIDISWCILRDEEKRRI